jgi:hypothetical protein
VFASPDLAKSDEHFERDVFLDTRRDPLFRALAYASVSVTSAHDMNKALNTYELQSNAKHPLFLLAHARLAEKHEDVLLQLALLHEYVRYVPQSNWLSEKEKKLLDMKELPCKRFRFRHFSGL